MSIRRELRKYYGPEHRAYRQKLISIYGMKCQKCGRDCRKYLNLAHISHDPRQPHRVALWCPNCHARNDAPHRVAMMRRSRARREGQLWLLPEIEYAPLPAWQVPQRAIDQLQGELF